jgi:hypothetical protein
MISNITIKEEKKKRQGNGERGGRGREAALLFSLLLHISLLGLIKKIMLYIFFLFFIFLWYMLYIYHSSSFLQIQ